MNRRTKGWKLALDKLSEEERVKLLCSVNCGKANVLGADYVPTPTDVFSPAFMVKQMEKVMEERKIRA